MQKQSRQKIVHEVPAPELIAAVIQSNWIIDQLLRQLNRVLPDLTAPQLRDLIREKVLLPSVTEGIQAQDAIALIKRMEDMRKAGLSMTQTIQVLSDPAASEADDLYRILVDDMRAAGHGG
jgi:hypothetical protein